MSIKDDYLKFQVDYDSISQRVQKKEFDDISNDHGLIIKREAKIFNVYKNRTLLNSFKEFDDAQYFINNFTVN